MAKKVLIADDEPNIVAALEYLLQQQRLRHARRARTARRRSRWSRATLPDVVLLDVMMPIKSGYEVCQRMRERPEWRHIKIVMLSAKGREAEVSKGLSLGADLYITKPFSTQELMARIRRFSIRTRRPSRTRLTVDEATPGGGMKASAPLSGSGWPRSMLGSLRSSARSRWCPAPASTRRSGDAYLAMLAERGAGAGLRGRHPAVRLRWRPGLGFSAATRRRRTSSPTRRGFCSPRIPEHKVVSTGGPEMGELAAAINQLADGYRRLERDLDAKSADARARVEEERNRFAALMSELSEGVVVCNADGRILLYNARAAKLLGARSRGPARGNYTPLGLGRSVFGLLDRDQVAHALDKIHQQLERNVERPHTRFVTGAANGALLRVQVAPFLSAERRVAGMVFTLDDVSGLIGREGQRLKLLQALATGIRAPVANLRAVAESLVAFPEMDVARRAQFVEIVAAESRVLTERLNTALSEYADALKGSLTLEDMRVVDLLTVVQRRIADAIGMPATHREMWTRTCGCGSTASRSCRRIASLAVAAARRLRHTRAAVPRRRERPLRRARPRLDRSDRRQRGARAAGRPSRCASAPTRRRSR